MNIANLHKSTNENEYQYTYRICKYKDSGLINWTWDELGTFLNNELEQNFTSSKYRKFYQYANICDKYVFMYRNTDEQINELKILNFELNKNKVKTRDERTELNRKIREEARKESYLDLVSRTFSNLQPKKLDFKKKEYISSDNDLIVHLTDIHAGIIINNKWNKFNEDILKDRINIYLNEILKIQKRHNSENCYVIIGEIISGLIHDNLRLETNTHIVEQFIIVASYISDFLIELSKYFNKVEVYITPGNHSRCVANKKSSMKGENLDNMLPFTLKGYLQNYKNILIKQNMEDESIAHFTVRGKNIMAAHGDKDSPKKIVQDFSLMFKEFPDIIYLGHRHTNGLTTISDCKVIETGCVSGTDNFAIDHRLTNKPEQTVSVISEKGLECLYDVQLN